MLKERRAGRTETVVSVLQSSARQVHRSCIHYSASSKSPCSINFVWRKEVGRAKENGTYKSTVEWPGILDIPHVIWTQDNTNKICHNNRVWVSRVHTEKWKKRSRLPAQVSFHSVPPLVISDFESFCLGLLFEKKSQNIETNIIVWLNSGILN